MNGDLEGNRGGLIDVLFRNLPGRLRKTAKYLSLGFPKF
jgi:hypothetical protein